ncbi:MAG: metallophosphoesterase [Clostridia bacterium]|nr:metallophosphoesterase [Clostridia bacterium]
MKRLIALLQIIALLPLAMIFPLQASAAPDIPDDMYEKPEMIEPEESWLIYDGEDDSPNKLTCNQSSAERVDLDGDHVMALLAPGGSKLIEFKAPFLQNNPISIEDYDYDELALRVQFYVSDPTVFTSNCEMELTSSGTCDKIELNFSPNKHAKLKAGWNSLYLPFSEGGVKNGQLDVTNINYMRFYFFLTDEITMALDNIMIVPAVNLDLTESFDSAAAAQKWTSTATAAAENGALKISGEGTINLTSSAYSLPIFRPTRTPICFNVKVADPTTVSSITLQLTDEDGNTASSKLDTSLLQANLGTSYEVLCSDMEADEEYIFELTEKITFKIVTTGETTLYLDNLTVAAYDTDYFYDWVRDYTSEPGEYSIAVIPDIQELSAIYPHKLNTITQWIADNKEKENILFAIDLGDVTWNGHTGDTLSSNSEFQNARNAFDMLTEVGIDYSICYGNHDYTPAGRDTSMFNKYFPLSLFQSFDSYGGTMYEDKSDNTYYTFKGGNTDYLVLAIEYNPDNKTISWANEVVTAHPNHKVIVTTHGYMQGDSAKTPAEENELAPAVGADRLWNQLLKKHENIIMLICGHAWSKTYSGDLVMRQDKGEHGNTVYQIMANAQDIDAMRGGVGMLLMLRFSEDGNVIDFNWFSPVSKDYAFREKNQFKLALNNEFSISGIEDGATYCDSVSFTVNSLTSATVKVRNVVMEPVDGVYTLPSYGRMQNVIVYDPFGDQIADLLVTVNEGHTGGEATCTAAAVCETCGESYGEPLPHTYGDDDKCTVCGADKPQQDIVNIDEKPFSPAFLIPIIAAVIAAGAAVIVVVTKKKKTK